MFNLFIIAVILLLGIIGFNIQNEGTYTIGVALMGVSLAYLIVTFISDLSHYQAQISRFENVRRNLNRIEIYKRKQKELLSEFKFYLGKKYPEFEKKIFDDINKSKTHMVLKYPEIKSSKTIIELTKKINELADDVYRLYNKNEKECKRIRYYNQSKWEIIKPRIPEDIIDVVYRNYNYQHNENKNTLPEGV